MEDFEAKWESTRDLISYVQTIISMEERADFEVSEMEKEEDMRRLGELYHQVYGVLASEVDYDKIIPEVQSIRVKYQDIEKFKKEVLCK